MTDQPSGALDDKVAVVLGASRGIGAAVARAYAQHGAAVVLAARDRDALERLAAEISEAGGRALVEPTDITDDNDVARLVDHTLSTFGRLDIACNNAAGGDHRPTPLAEVPLEAFESVCAVNLRGTFLALRHEIPAMLSSGGGAIVNMSSTAGIQAVGGLAAYVATKHAIEGLTKVAALDYATHGVRVNSIAPGPILTDALLRAGAGAQSYVADSLPMHRVGQPDEVAAAAVWLCSDQAAFVTGSTLVIDGGKLAGAPPFATNRGG